jgi:hypothetical protein
MLTTAGATRSTAVTTAREYASNKPSSVVWLIGEGSAIS